METKGKLRQMPPGMIGFAPVAIMKCDDCATTFTANVGRPFTINGTINDGLCPWCRSDSKPWTHGRGL